MCRVSVSVRIPTHVASAGDVAAVFGRRPGWISRWICTHSLFLCLRPTIRATRTNVEHPFFSSVLSLRGVVDLSEASEGHLCWWRDLLIPRPSGGSPVGLSIRKPRCSLLPFALGAASLTRWPRSQCRWPLRSLLMVRKTVGRRTPSPHHGIQCWQPLHMTLLPRRISPSCRTRSGYRQASGCRSVSVSASFGDGQWWPGCPDGHLHSFQCCGPVSSSLRQAD
ncbi:hypothetical protein F5X68DRAFT_60420 [Plectosphaerella plurivora]|uniref:Uncharacterized protein n=1 Tax=Plectosphaerella plurivora TaxID=936078 RepID=A0A9P8VIE5_9PEZI|nr:hypothetical protein F5X68DRAFT_60420 [Plectosphaerella plurivora]